MPKEPRVLREMFTREAPTTEDEYFYEIDRQLIRERRQQADAKRQSQRAAHQKDLHWMRCPKCGSEMGEVDVSGVLVEQCRSCRGVFFDRSELQTFVEALTENTAMRGFWGKIVHSLSSGDTQWRP